MTPKKTRRALGRGLSNLIPMNEGEIERGSEILEVDIQAISANPFQPRRDFNEEDIKELAGSIESQGLLQPVILRRKAGKYEIVSGERRIRALKFLGKNTISSIIKERVSDNKMLEIALVENVQREDLNEIELAQSYQKLLFDCGLSHKELSKRVGKSRSVITNTQRLLKLPERIQEMVRDGTISMGHARALLSIKNPQRQYALAEKIVSQGLTVRNIEHISQRDHTKTKYTGENATRKAVRRNKIDPDTLYQEEQLRYHFGTDVRIIMNARCKGKIEVRYYGKEDLNRVLNIMLP